MYGRPQVIDAGYLLSLQSEGESERYAGKVQPGTICEPEVAAMLGDPPEKRPTTEQNTTQMFSLEGAHVERIKVTNCDTDEKAIECVRRVRRVLSKLKAARG